MQSNALTQNMKSTRTEKSAKQSMTHLNRAEYDGNEPEYNPAGNI